MITKFNLFEKVNWEYVKENPECESEECLYIKEMEKHLNDIKKIISNKDIFDIYDIRYFDQYQGSFGVVTIFNKKYKVWLISEDYPEEYLWIESFPIDNTTEDGQFPGYKGGVNNIADLLIDIDNNGGIENYKNIKKYNL